MTTEKEVAKAAIEAFKIQHGGTYPEYYIGITNNLTRRLIESIEEQLNEHAGEGSYNEGDAVYSAECESREIAIEIEQYFQLKGMQIYNPRARGVAESRFIYCYKENTDFNLNRIVENSAKQTKPLKLTNILSRDEFLEKEKQKK